MGELAEHLVGAAPVVAHRIAILAVPFGPQRREVADLVAALADVPGLGDQLDLADDRILLNQIEERRQPIDFVQLARERRRKVEAEAVDVHLEHPVAQRIHQQLQHVRMPHVQAVPGARVVHVVARLVADRPVVGGVVEALERQHRSEVIAFGGVVVDDVEDHFDAGRVQRLDHLLELADLLAALAGARVLVVRREEADRVVAPVVAQPARDEVAVVDELMHRHQFDGADAEPGQVIERSRVGESGIGAAQRRRNTGHAGREPLDVQLVDFGLVQRPVRMPVVAPVECVVSTTIDRGTYGALSISPRSSSWRPPSSSIRNGKTAASNRPGPRSALAYGSSSSFVGIAAEAARWIPRAVDAKP